MEFNMNNEMLILIGLIILLIYVYYTREGFEASGTEFIDVGSERYGIRGDKLRRSNIARVYIRPDRHIRISASGGDMYESDRYPCKEGINGCQKITCPSYGYDNIDTCWSCGSAYPTPMKIPDIHPHVAN